MAPKREETILDVWVAEDAYTSIHLSISYQTNNEPKASTTQVQVIAPCVGIILLITT